MLPEVTDLPKNSANEAFAQDFKFSVQVSQIRILGGLRASAVPKLNPWNVSEAVPPTNTKTAQCAAFKGGGPTRTRTVDQRIMSPLL